MADVFISYAREDRVHAERLAEKLAEAGLDVWWDLDSLRLGVLFSRAIEQAVNDARGVIVLWSAHSSDSEWVERPKPIWPGSNGSFVRSLSMDKWPSPFLSIHAMHSIWRAGTVVQNRQFLGGFCATCPLCSDHEVELRVERRGGPGKCWRQ